MNKAFAVFGKLSLGILIAAVLVAGGVYLGIKGNKNKTVSPTPTPIVQVSPSPILSSPNPATASPSLMPNQTVVVNGTTPFASFSASIPNDFQTKKEIIADRVKVTFSNGSASVIISQAGGEVGQCIYPGENPVSFSSSFQTPTQINGVGVQFKRASAASGSISDGIQTFTVCELRSGSYQFPTQFGYITYQTDPNPKVDVLSQLDQIVGTLKEQ